MATNDTSQGWASRPLMVLFAAMLGVSVSFNLLLAALPSYAKSIGAGDIGAGITTAAFMFAAVLTEVATPQLITRFGHRRTFAAGLVLLGGPSLALNLVSNVAGIVTVCLARGVGLAIVCVLGYALVAQLVPDEHRGQALGSYGVVVGVPSVVALATGNWTVAHIGYSSVFTIGGFAALIGVAAVPVLPSRAARPAGEQHVRLSDAVRAPGIAFPAIGFAITTMAAGALLTFLPLAVDGGSGKLLVVLFAVQAIATTFARLWSGRYIDRRPAGRALLVPAVITTAVGMLALAVSGNPIVATIGMVVFGLGFGVAQGASQAMMFDRVPKSGYGAASALWNIAYDTGLGVGAAGFGVVSSQTGYRTAFALTAVSMLVILLTVRGPRGARTSTRRYRTAHSPQGRNAILDGELSIPGNSLVEAMTSTSERATT